MADARPILIATLEGRTVFAVTTGPTVGPAIGASFDRIRLFASGTDDSFLVDADAALSSFAVDRDSAGNLVAVRLSAAIRCHIAGSAGYIVPFAGRLTKDANWLKFASGRLGSESFSNKLISELADIRANIGCEFDATLFDHIGLRVQGGPVEAAFVKAPRPAPESQPWSDEPASSVHVIRFRRHASLVACDQRLTVGPVCIELPVSIIRRFKLSGSATNPKPIDLVQTPLVILDQNDSLDSATGRAVVTVGGLPSVPVVQAWNRHAAGELIASLQTVQDGRPVSTLPQFDLPAEPMTACDPCCDPPPATTAQWTDCDRLRWMITLEVEAGKSSAECDPDRLDARFRAATPLPAKIDTVDVDSFMVRFRAILRHDRDVQPLVLPFAIQRAILVDPQPGIPEAQAERNQSRVESNWRGFTFNARQLFIKENDPTRNEMAKRRPQRVRFGALDLEFDPVLTDKPIKELIPSDWDHRTIDRESRFQVGYRMPRVLSHADLPTTAARLMLRVNRLAPGGQDGLPDEPFNPGELDPDVIRDAIKSKFFREPPVTIPLDLPANGPFTLQAIETTDTSRSQSLTVQLFERPNDGVPLVVAGDSAESFRLVIVDRHAFGVFGVEAPAFRGLAGADGNREVGNWSTAAIEGASWELAGATNGFQLALPPQAVGEGMEKRKDQTGVVVDVGVDKAAGFRLSPAARLHLASSYMRQNFTEAVWNLRRILGYPSQRAPGAAAAAMQFELLYGLGCRVASPGVRVAELASRLGAVPNVMPDTMSRPFGDAIEQVRGDTNAYNRARTRWANSYAAYLSRLAILELWAEAQPGQLRLSHADGVRYTLRDPRQLIIDPTQLNAETNSSTGWRLLAGGALWGLHFPAEYKPFLRPGGFDSEDGQLVRPAFSALGGWGYQKAVFLKGITTIYSDTAMGRVFFYSVEQIGRIAGFWNRAKHVKVYERTVAPTLQFMNSQDHHAGRPLIRKVREFVELIQPIRTYPDFDAAPITRGCVLGIEFKTKIIFVDSDWGHTVTDPNGEARGYAIPLWRPGTDPRVYPKPQIGLRIAGAEAEGETLPAELDEPEKLFFYSEPGADTADTDLWDAVCDVDFPDLDWPTADPPQPNPAADLDAQQPDELPTAAGYDAYTYAIVAAKPVNIVATRTSAPVGALLRNVTMVRSNPAATPQDALKADWEAVSDGRSKLSAAVRGLDQLLTALPRPGDAAARIEAIKKQITDTANTIQKAGTESANVFGTKLTLTARNWLKEANQDLERWRADATRVLNQEFVTRLLPYIRDFQGTSAEIVQTAKKLIADQVELFKLRVPAPDAATKTLIDILNKSEGAAKQAIAAARGQVAAVQAELNRMLNGLDGTLTDDVKKRIRTTIEDAIRRCRSAVRDPLHQAADLSARYFEQIPTDVRKAIAEAEATAKAELQKVLAQLDKTADDVRKTVRQLESLNGEIAKIVDALVTKANGIAEVRKNLEEKAKQLLTDTFGGVKLQSIVDELNKRLQDVIKDGMDALGIANALSAQLQQEARTVADAVAKITNAATYKDLVEQQIGKLAGVLQNAVPDSVKTFFSDATQWEKKVKEVLDQIGDPNAARKKLEELIGDARGKLDTLAGQIVGPIAAKFPQGLTQQAGNVLRLVRAFGDAPIVEGMGFTREKLGYFYDPLKRLAADGTLPIDITPVNALVNRAGNFLKSAGVRLPTGNLLDQVLPAPDSLLKDFDLTKLLPDFAGMNLSKLFPDLKAPAGLKDKVKITHQFDRQAGRGWVQADIHIPEPGPTTLFDAGPVKVEVSRIDLKATIRIEAGLGGGPQRTQSGRLSANWDLTVGGQQFITFADTSLTFDQSGRTKFDLDPKKVRLNGVLQMLSEAFAKLSSPDDGFTLRLVEDGGFPVGVEAALSIPLPDCSAGPCGLSNLRFGAVFELVARPEFAIGVRAYISQKTAPFTLVIFILGGGGWIDVRARYLPLSGRITTTVSIGLSAGAMLAIAFGPVKGSVFAFFYIEAEMQTDTAAAGTQLTIRVGLLLGGEVDVLGLISVSIKLLLELEYNAATGILAGTGTLSIRVKICWFLTIKVSVSVRKEFAKVGGQSNAGAAAPMLEALDAAAAPVLFPFIGDPTKVPVGNRPDAVKTYLSFVE